jgi:hypothetical protein
VSEIGKRINAVIGHGLAPLLEEVGFRRKGRTFRRESPDRIDVINVQGSKWNAGRTGEFTINVGVYYPRLAELYDPYRPDGLPEEYHCTIRNRIGMLMGRRTDKWWKLGRYTRDEKVSADVTDCVRDHALPWLEEMSDLDNVKREVSRFVAAVIACHQGRNDEARRLIVESCDEAPAVAGQTKAWAIEHGLINV